LPRYVKSEHWEEQVASLSAKLHSVPSDERSVEEVERFCESVRHRLATMTSEEKRQFLLLVVEKAWLDAENNLEIEIIVPRPDIKTVVANCETAISLTP
jgi:hypothetical protein